MLCVGPYKTHWKTVFNNNNCSDSEGLKLLRSRFFFLPALTSHTSPRRRRPLSFTFSYSLLCAKLQRNRKKAREAKRARSQFHTLENGREDLKHQIIIWEQVKHGSW